MKKIKYNRGTIFFFLSFSDHTLLLLHEMQEVNVDGQEVRAIRRDRIPALAHDACRIGRRALWWVQALGAPDDVDADLGVVQLAVRGGAQRKCLPQLQKGKKKNNF